jgi:hypothetical protein
MILDTITIGDMVEFDYSTGVKSGKVLSILDEGNRINVELYCVDNSGGYTLTAPIFNINKILRETSVAEEIKKPVRYNKKGKLECWDVILDQEMNFLEGNILKYVWRYKEKSGIEDLKKARVYLDKLISELEGK